MILKIEQLQRIYKTGIMAVVRAETPEAALSIVEAIKEGGIDIIEITFTVPGAVKVMEELHRTYSEEEMLLGAGTVLDAETARTAMLAGAEYIVSPNLNHEIVKLCNRYQIICIPGCMTVNEMVSALEAGADLIKLFPGNVFGPSYIKDIKGPLPHAQVVPTGGVNLDNVQQWIRNGCFAVGVGSQLTKEGRDNLRKITETARSFVEKIQKVRNC